MKFYKYLKENLKPIGHPIGGVKDPDWIPVEKDHRKFLCKKCGYPLLGFGKNLPSSDFVSAKDGTLIECPNCKHDNNIGNFEGYIDKKGNISNKYFNRTTPVFNTIFDEQ